ncbi:MAG: hypothetical protein ACD_13C00163G0001, partial [uncultured bacterium]
MAISQNQVASASSVAVAQEDQSMVFAYLLTVPVQQKKTLTFTYSLNSPDQIKRPLSYIYAVNKQAGTGNDELQVKLTYPASWQIAPSLNSDSDVAGVAVVANDAQTTYNSNLSQDRI